MPISNKQQNCNGYIINLKDKSHLNHDHTFIITPCHVHAIKVN